MLYNKINIKPTLHSHTHCQVAPADLKPKLGKECSALPHEQTDRQPNTEREHRTHNITYTQAGVSCFVGQESGKFEVQFFRKFSGRKPCLRIAESR